MKHISNHWLLFLCFLHVQNTTGRRPGKQEKKDQPRRARSIYGDGHLEDIQRFYAEGSSERKILGEKLSEVSKEEPSASSVEEKKPFVFS